MTPSLYRDQFLDREWGPAELDTVASCGSASMKSAAKPHSFTPLPEHHTEIRIRGVPRADAGRVGARSRSAPPPPTSGTRGSPIRTRIPFPSRRATAMAATPRHGRSRSADTRGRGVRWPGDRDSLHGRGCPAARREHARPGWRGAGWDADPQGHLCTAGTMEGDDKAAQFARWAFEARFLAALDDSAPRARFP